MGCRRFSRMLLERGRHGWASCRWDLPLRLLQSWLPVSSKRSAVPDALQHQPARGLMLQDGGVVRQERDVCAATRVLWRRAAAAVCTVRHC